LQIHKRINIKSSVKHHCVQRSSIVAGLIVHMSAWASLLVTDYSCDLCSVISEIFKYIRLQNLN